MDVEGVVISVVLCVFAITMLCVAIAMPFVFISVIIDLFGKPKNKHRKNEKRNFRKTCKKS